MKRKRVTYMADNADYEGKKVSSNLRKTNKPVFGRGIRKTFKNIVSHTKKHIQKLKPKCKKVLMKVASETAQELASDFPIKLPRIIPVPKTGGFLPLIPIFAGLSAAGSLAGGAAGIAKAVNDYRNAQKRLKEMERHNSKIESLCIGKGLQLKPYKDGLGIFVTKKKN